MFPSPHALSDQVQRSRVRGVKGAEAEQAILRSNSRRSCEGRIGQKESPACPPQSRQKTPTTADGKTHAGVFPWFHYLFPKTRYCQSIAAAHGSRILMLE